MPGFIELNDQNGGSIYQGTDWILPVQYKDEIGNIVPLVSYSAIAQIRKNRNSPLISELSTTNGKITIENDFFVLKLTAEETELMNFDYAELELRITSPNGVVKDLLEARIKFNRSLIK